MNSNPEQALDDLERRASRVPHEAPPAEWRARILATAREAMSEGAGVRESRGAPETGRRVREGAAAAWGWREWFAAPWGALAGALGLILLLNGAGAWLERELPGDSDARWARKTPATERGFIAMARAYRAALSAWASGETDDPVGNTVPSEQRPRGEFVPAPGRREGVWIG